VSDLTWYDVPVPAGATAHVAYTGRSESQGVMIEVDLHIVFVDTGRVETQLTFVTANRETDPALITSATARVVQQMDNQ